MTIPLASVGRRRIAEALGLTVDQVEVADFDFGRLRGVGVTWSAARRHAVRVARDEQWPDAAIFELNEWRAEHPD